MKIAPLDDLYPVRVGLGYGGLSSSSGSNSAISEEILSSIASNASVGSNSLLRTTGGAGAVTTIAAAGAAQTLMVGGANTFDLTLTANLTLGLTGAAASGSESNILVLLRQGGSGSYTVTWPGSVDWAGGSAPTLATAVGSVDAVVLETVNGGTDWLGFAAGGGSGGTPATTVEAETTYGLASAVGTDTEYARQDHTHGSPSLGTTSTTAAAGDHTHSGLIGAILISDTPSTPLVFADLIQNEAQDDLVYADV